MNTNRLTRIVFRIVFLFWPFYRVRAHHAERVRRDGAVIIVAKHQRLLDILILTTAIRREIRYMAKKSLFKNRFFAWILRNGGAFPVTQDSADRGAIRTAAQKLSEGEVLGIFAEGKRIEGDIVGEIKAGLTLAIKYSKVDCELVPCGIHYGKRGPVLTVDAYFGEVFTLQECGETETEILEGIRQRMQDAQNCAKNISLKE